MDCDWLSVWWAVRYLSSYSTAGLPGRRRLKDPLLLLRGQGGVQGDDLDVPHLGPQVVHLPLDPLARLVDLLEKGGGPQRWRTLVQWFSNVLGQRHPFGLRK